MYNGSGFRPLEVGAGYRLTKVINGWAQAGGTPGEAQMNPTNAWSLPGQTTAERRAPERQVPMLDTVKVAPETFRSLEFRSAAEKREFVQAGRGAQKFDRDNVPLWTVRVIGEIERGGRVMDELFTVSVPMQVNPGEKFDRGQSIWLPGLTFGVTAKRDGSGFMVWLSADGIEPAGSGAKAAAS